MKHIQRQQFSFTKTSIKMSSKILVYVFHYVYVFQIICEQLVNYLEKHKILYEFQFGFRKGHSTSQAIAEIADNLRNAIDNNLYSCGVFLDFSMAFDTVNHTILL